MPNDLLVRSQLEKIASTATDILRGGQVVDASPSASPGWIDLSPGDVRRYSIGRAIQSAAAATMVNQNSFRLDGFEGECDRAIQRVIGPPKSGNGFYVPLDVLHYRDLTVASPSGGGYLASTSVGSLIDLRRAFSVLLRLGAQLIPGLKDSLTFPRLSTGHTVTWLASESTQASESTAGFQQVSASPKTVSAYTEASRQLLLQAGGDHFIKPAIARDLATAGDAAALNGSGSSGEPLGIMGTSGVTTFLSAASMNNDAMVAAQLAVGEASAVINPDAVGFVAPPAVAALMQKRPRFSGADTPLWEGAAHKGVVVGVPAYSTMNMPASSGLYGDFSQCAILEWGILEISVNPFANFKAGIVGVRSLWSIDVGVLHPEAFTKAVTIS